MKEEINVDVIIDKYSDMINRMICRKLNSIEDTEDILQEVFIKYVRHIKSGKKFNTEEHEKCWLARVAMNLCKNELKYNKMRMTVPLNEEIYCELEINQDNVLVSELSRLDKKYRESFELFYFDDLKVSEISKILKISEANVKTRLKRARDKLKEIREKGENTNG